MGECEHRWFVYSTALSDRILLLECATCDMKGSVVEPTDEEWEKASGFGPYLWSDVERVKVEARPDPEMPGVSSMESMGNDFYDIRCGCLMDDESLEEHEGIQLGKRRELHLCERCWRAIVGDVLSVFMARPDTTAFYSFPWTGNYG